MLRCTATYLRHREPFEFTQNMVYLDPIWMRLGAPRSLNICDTIHSPPSSLGTAPVLSPLSDSLQGVRRRRFAQDQLCFDLGVEFLSWFFSCLRVLQRIPKRALLW